MTLQKCLFFSEPKNQKKKKISQTHSWNLVNYDKYQKKKKN